MASFRDDESCDTTGKGVVRTAPRDESKTLCLWVVGEGIFATHPLPAAGDVVIGRASESDVQIDDPAISRKHAVIHLGPPLRVADLGSFNGTRVGERAVKSDEPIELALGEVVDLGPVMIMVQRGSVGRRPRRLWSHGYFEGRLEDECTRSERSGQTFAVGRLRIEGPVPVPASIVVDAAGEVMRAVDQVAAYAQNEYEALFTDVTPGEANDLLVEIARRIGETGARCTSGLACYPRDGRTPEDLIAKAGAVVHGGDAASERSPPSVIVKDRAMQGLYRMVERIAAGTIGVLLLGETGVGKEVMAETVHRRSPRADKPFLRLNCAAFSETLLESELFGHEKGAFTGAVQSKPGLLESADGGTVFLDEVGELPMSVQVKLLRVLEDKQVTRVGGLKPHMVDVRFIAATNRDLEAEVARGAFRRDLFYRLNGFSLVIPPLRERPAEIEALARVFLAQASRQMERSREARLSKEALLLLLRYGWPGNIRELKNAIERAVLLCTDDVITPEHLPAEKMSSLFPSSGSAATAMAASTAAAPGGRGPSELASSPPGAAFPRAPSALAPAPGVGGDESAEPELKPGALRDEIESVERQRILDALDRFGGNQTQTAKFLGISRGTLVSRLEVYGVPRPRKPSKIAP